MDLRRKVEKVLENIRALLGFCDFQTCPQNAELQPMMDTPVVPLISC